VQMIYISIIFFKKQMFVNKILYEFLQLHGECYFKFFLCFLICFCVSSRQTGALNRIIDRAVVP
jgi:hypothetical protein